MKKRLNPDVLDLRIFRIAFTASLLLALALTLSCSSGSEGGENPSSFADKGNDISNYAIVTIGSQTWMAENLNYSVAGSKCYGEGGKVSNCEKGDGIKLSSSEIQSNCDKYGRLYTLEAAMNACPSGWHLPDNEEWDMLINNVGGSEIAGKKLKAASGWNDYNGKTGNGTDDYGFAALPGGIGDLNGHFDCVGKNGFWWSASEDDDGDDARSMEYARNDIGWFDNYQKTNLNSVRCVKD